MRKILPPLLAGMFALPSGYLFAFGSPGAGLVVYPAVLVWIVIAVVYALRGNWKGIAYLCVAITVALLIGASYAKRDFTPDSNLASSSFKRPGREFGHIHISGFELSIYQRSPGDLHFELERWPQVCGFLREGKTLSVEFRNLIKLIEGRQDGRNCWTAKTIQARDIPKTALVSRKSTLGRWGKQEEVFERIDGKEKLLTRAVYSEQWIDGRGAISRLQPVPDRQEPSRYIRNLDTPYAIWVTLGLSPG